MDVSSSSFELNNHNKQKGFLCYALTLILEGRGYQAGDPCDALVLRKVQSFMEHSSQV